MDFVIPGVLMGILATVGTDLWAAVLKHLLHLPTANWRLVGRWFGHMPRGAFVHRTIVDSAAIPNERAIGWIAHYVTGIVYGVAYFAIVQLLLSRDPALSSALLFGLVTLVAPWLIMQPGMGFGMFASKTPRPVLVRLINLSVHLVFGTSLYLAWLLLWPR